MEDREFKGVWIPKEIWLNYKLNILDKAILVEIDSLDREERGCFAGNKHFAEMFGCTERQVSASISRLTKMGFVEIIGFDGRHRSMRSCITKISMQDGNICEARNDGVAGAKNPSGCITKTSIQTDENFQSASPKFLHSNTYSNTERETKSIPSNISITINGETDQPIQNAEDSDEQDNPFGADTGHRPNQSTVYAYASQELQSLGYRAMQELQSFADDTSEELVRHAIDNALDQGVRTWSYVRSILNSYADENIKTVGEAKAYDDKRRKEKSMSNQHSQYCTQRTTPEEEEQKRKDKEFYDRVFASTML